MHVLPIVNQKGGAGKTNVAVNVAAEAAALGFRVLVVDLDPQHTSTDWMIEVGAGVEGVAEAMGYGADASTPVDVKKLIRYAPGFGCSILPADTDKLTAVEKGLGGSDLFKLADALVPLEDDFDIIIIDCPPRLGDLVSNAVVAASGIVIPIDGSEALDGFVALEAFLAKHARIAKVDVAAVFVTKARLRTRHHRDIVDALASVQGYIPDVIRLTTEASELHSRRMPARKYRPNGKAHKDYTALTDAILRRAGAIVDEGKSA